MKRSSSTATSSSTPRGSTTTSTTTTTAVARPAGRRSKDDAAAALDFDDEAPDGESWSDDPVRMYLTQMGEIPLLTRQQEINLAKQDRDSPAPRSAAGCWRATTSFSAAYKVLKRVHAASCRSTARCRSR